jgi:hypothetical protein
MIKGKPCIWLQCYGYQPAVMAKDIKPGMTRVYNYGHTYEIKAVEVGKMVTLTVVSADGKEYQARHRPDKYIPVK